MRKSKESLYEYLEPSLYSVSFRENNDQVIINLGIVGYIASTSGKWPIN